MSMSKDWTWQNATPRLQLSTKYISVYNMALFSQPKENGIEASINNINLPDQEWDVVMHQQSTHLQLLYQVLVLKRE